LQTNKKNNMSCVANVIGGLLGRTRKDELQIAELSRISVEQICGWRSGRDLFITPKELVRLARAFSPKGKEFVETHARLLHAHLKDMCIGPGAKFICLEVTSKPDWLMTTSHGRVDVSPALLGDLQVIHNNIWRNKMVRMMVRTAAKGCRSQGLN
jgi:hypothetical protein